MTVPQSLAACRFEEREEISRWIAGWGRFDPGIGGLGNGDCRSRRSGERAVGLIVKPA